MFDFTEAQIRLGVFAGLFVILAILELVLPRRIPKDIKTRRWLTNWSIVMIDSLVVRLIFTGGAVFAALWAARQGNWPFQLDRCH